MVLFRGFYYYIGLYTVISGLYSGYMGVYTVIWGYFGGFSII